jgi:hypothetical protein
MQRSNISLLSIILRIFPLSLLFGAALLRAQPPAAARPELARKEGQPCIYCHVSPSPGAVDPVTRAKETTMRNGRGLYYAAHNHSFAGYDERAVMGARSAPLFRFGWRATLNTPADRMGVGDVAGDGKLRLVTLDRSSSGSLVRVLRWDGQAFVRELEAPDGSAGPSMEVGRFAGAGRPAVIVTPSGLLYWSGGKLVRWNSGGSLALLGTACMRDGQERLLISRSPKEATAWRVSLASGASNWLVDGIAAPNSGALSWGEMHGSPEFLEKMGLVESVAAGGILGVWDPRGFGATFLYYAKIVQDFDTAPDPGNPQKPRFVVKGRSYYITFQDPTIPSFERQIRSGVDRQHLVNPYVSETSALDGPILDIAVTDPKGSGKPGLLVLTRTGETTRTLTWYSLD